MMEKISPSELRNFIKITFEILDYLLPQGYQEVLFVDRKNPWRTLSRLTEAVEYFFVAREMSQERAREIFHDVKILQAILDGKREVWTQVPDIEAKTKKGEPDGKGRLVS